jgi:predicted dehydrogenase
MKILNSFILLFFVSALAFSQKPVKIGIVGMTHDHVWQILNNPNYSGIELVGFAEPNRELALSYLKRVNLPDSLWFPSLEDMIQKTQLEAVCDFRSTIQHLETVQKCAPLKIHVMVEKPLAVDLKSAKQMESLAKKHGIQIITNYETTWYSSHHKAFELINKENKIGEIRKVVIMDGHSGPKEIGCSKAFLDWLTDPIMNGGGALMDFGCYGADIMAWLMKGEKPLSVSAITKTYKPAIYPKVDDEATILVQYPKAQGIFQASWNWPFDRKDTEIYGQNGYIFANREKQMKIKTGERNKSVEQIIETTPLVDPFDNAFSYFAAVVRGQINPENDLGSLKINMVAMEILDAAKKSSKTGKVVYLK